MWIGNSCIHGSTEKAIESLTNAYSTIGSSEIKNRKNEIMEKSGVVKEAVEDGKKEERMVQETNWGYI